MHLVKRLPSGTIDEVLDITEPTAEGPGKAVWYQRRQGTVRLELVRQLDVPTVAHYACRLRDAHMAGMKREDP